MSRILVGRSISELLPPEWRQAFSAPVSVRPDQPEAGLYFSSYIDWHRLLSLPSDGPFLLLLWRTDRSGQIQPEQTRSYSGKAKLTRFKTGDRCIELDFQDAEIALSSDLWDSSLYVVDDGDTIRLLRKKSIRDFATLIGWNSTLGKSQRYFTRVSGIDVVPDLRPDGVVAPPRAALPQSIQRLIPDEPLCATILSVGEVPDRNEPDATPIMVMIDKGSEDGIRHNMPLASPAGTDRALIGWCSAPEANRCPVRIKVKRDEAGNPAALPVVGDVLISRAPSAPPMR